MPQLTDLRRLIPLAATVLFAAPPAPLAGQRDLELHVGRWWNAQRSTIYELRTSYPLRGVFTHGLAATVLIHDNLGRNRAFYGGGYELQAGRRRSALAPYALAGVALGLSTDTTTQAVAAHWSIGGGIEWRPLSRFALGAELRYRLEDRGPRGFWRGRDTRGGVSFAAGFAIGLGRATRSYGGGGRPPLSLPPAEPPVVISGNAADVVRTALDVLGRPYVWGGTSANGFDCSGLVQYAYAQHGIRLPRMSRDQAQVGAVVTPVVEALVPGDILLFSARPGGGVTHVGLFVGEGKFIHSSSTGVKLSRLDPHDPEASWWLPRWVGARRVVPTSP